MKFIKLQNYLQFSLILAILVLMWGCGSNGGTGTNGITSKSASVSVIPSESGEYIIQGNNMDGVAGIDLTMNYDSTVMSSPTVTQGGFISGAKMATNTTLPGIIRIAIIMIPPLSGSGQIATVSFAAQLGAAGITITSVKLIDNKGALVP